MSTSHKLGKSVMPVTAVLAVAAAIVVSASVAVAAVSYSPATGGVAGKGDVQSALGVNDKQLMTLHEADNIEFAYQGVATYEQVCTQVLEAGRPTFEVVTAKTTNDYSYVLPVSAAAVTVTSTKASGKLVGVKSLTGFQLSGVTLPPAPSNICPAGFEPYASYDGPTGTSFNESYWGPATSPLLVGGNGILKVNDRPLPNTPV